MANRDRTVLLCDCGGTMRLDAAPVVHRQLCRAQLDAYERALGEGKPVLVACTQEAPLFTETRDEAAPDAAVSFVNIRERAGWSEEGAAAGPKIAALLAEAAVEVPATPAVALRSAGAVLIYGRDDAALAAAERLAGRLDVTLLLTGEEEVMPPRVMAFPVFRGRVRGASGHLGAFTVTVDGYAVADPSSRRSLVFGRGEEEAALSCDLILDLTGGTPLFPATRDGYVRPDPGNPALIAAALFDLADLVGEFDKPRYVAFAADICAHGRSRKTGCTRCLDLCPTGAIASAGDAVAIDPYICGGCGACAGACPTGAARYGLPPTSAVLERLRTLLGAWFDAGGERPVLLVHDPRRGEETVFAIARYGRGLPANVLPFAVHEVTQIGFDFLAVALAYGAARVVLLAAEGEPGPLTGLRQQAELAETVMAGLGHDGGRVIIVEAGDPFAVEERLRDLAAPEPLTPARFLAMGGRREIERLALAHLHATAPAPVEHLPLPAGAPFGAVEVDSGGCTLCLACVSACPTGALVDNPDRPMLGFIEANCVQCGLCRTTCPEKVVTLVPRLDFTAAARETRVLHQEEPFACVRCGKAFGVRASVDRMVERLKDHPMFAAPGALDRIRMCDTCRVVVQFEAPNPLAAGPRPPTRTTDDYLRDRDKNS